MKQSILFSLLLFLLPITVFALPCPPSGTVVTMVGPNNNGTSANTLEYAGYVWTITVQTGTLPSQPINGGGVVLQTFIKAEWYAEQQPGGTPFLCYYTYSQGTMLLTSQSVTLVPLPLKNKVPQSPWVFSGGNLYTCTESSNACAAAYVSSP